MTDEELIARLRGCPFGTKQTDALLVKAADRIEALTKERDDYAHKLMQANNTYTEMHLEIERLSDKLATCEKYRDAYAEMDKIGTQAMRDLEAKLAKAVEALERAKASIENGGGGGVVDVVWLDGPCPETLCDFIDATLAEIKGESHDPL